MGGGVGEMGSLAGVNVRGLRPKIHGYTGCKRTGFVKRDSVKLAMGHLLNSEAAP